MSNFNIFEHLLNNANLSHINIQEIVGTMKIFKIMLCIIPMLFAFFVVSCSNGNSPVDPDSVKVPDTMGFQKIDGRNIVAVYDAMIDPAAGTCTITPTDRIGAFHYPISQFYSKCVKITAFGWSPTFWMDVQLTHPTPGSGMSVFDPRVIAIIPATAGNSFNYPTFNANGNDVVVVAPDGYTKLFDALGGTIAGNTNPFKAYFKSQPNREWSSTGVTTETQRWNMVLSGFGGPLVYKLVVDVSTNSPAPPTPFIDNAAEPVDIQVSVGPGLIPTGGSAIVTATLLDWKGRNNINCAIEAPALFNGLVSMAYSADGPDPNTYIYTGTISNSKNASAGTYRVMVGSSDLSTNIYMYKESAAVVRTVSTAHVRSVAFLQKDVQDQWFDIAVAPNSFVYVCANHPATDNVNSKRTTIRFQNNLSGKTVLNPGVGMNDPDGFGVTKFWNRLDVTNGGYLVTNPGLGTLESWSISGNIATPGFYSTSLSCGGGWKGNIGFIDVWHQSNPNGSYGIGYTETTDCYPNNGGTIMHLDGASIGQFGRIAPIYYDYYTIVGVDGIEGTENALFFISDPNNGKLSISGSWMNGQIGGTITEYATTGTYGTGDGQFQNGLDLSIDSLGNVVTVERFNTSVYRFQKFDSSLNWIWSSGWDGPGSPGRIHFNRGNNQLYVLCDLGINICEVD